MTIPRSMDALQLPTRSQVRRPFNGTECARQRTTRELPQGIFKLIADLVCRVRVLRGDKLLSLSISYQDMLTYDIITRLLRGPGNAFVNHIIAVTSSQRDARCPRSRKRTCSKSYCPSHTSWSCCSSRMRWSCHSTRKSRS